jgi:CRISPR-associated protein Cas2
VFEVVCTQADLLILTDRNSQTIDTKRDNMRIYRMRQGSFDEVQTLGNAKIVPHRHPLVM